LPAAAHQFDVADLGCGTGLCGPLVRPWARRLAGCDLSAGMLEQAAGRGDYDVLDKTELVQFLEARGGAFDVVISADTLCYFGDLRAVTIAARHAMRAGGHFVFTVEALADDSPEDYRLLVNGRYAHAPAYVERLLTDAGLRPHRLAREVLRQEFGLPVNGFLVTASLDS
jgi:predicted TPR repeat methyltransferase